MNAGTYTASASRCISSSRNRASALLCMVSSNHLRIGAQHSGRQHQQRAPGHGENAVGHCHEHERRQQNLRDRLQIKHHQHAADGRGHNAQLEVAQPGLALQAQPEHGIEHGKARSREASQYP